LPNLLGTLRQLTSTFSGGFMIFALVGFGCVFAILQVSRTWEGAFVGKGGTVSGTVSRLLPEVENQ